MSYSFRVKNAKRKAISLDTKIKILDQLATGQGATDVGKHFGIHEATIRTIKKNEIAIRNSVCSGTKISAKSSSYIRDIVKEKMEKALVTWIEDKSQKRIPVDGITIKQTALRIYKRIKEVEPSTSVQSNKEFDFSASTGWMTGFFKRHALHNIKIKGETANANKEFPQKLCKIIEDGGYTPDQVWNVDESGNFWKRMPNRTYVAKSQKSAGGFKVAKDRDPLLFCSNVVNKSLSENEIVDLTLETHHDIESSDNDEEDPPVLNETLIKEGLYLASQLGNHFEQHDPDKERAGKFQRELKSLMASYRELYNGLYEKQQQSLITDFVLKTTKLSSSQEDISSDSSDDISVLHKRMRSISESDTE